MKYWTRRIAVLLAVVMLIGSLSGCGSGTIGDYASTVVATYGSENIYLDEASFWLRYEQWINEAYYWDLYTYFGYENMWTADMGDDGETMAEYLHENVMAQILQTRILLDHAEDYGIELTEDQVTKVSEFVADFLETYPGFTAYTDATQEQMEEWVQKNAVANLVIQAVKDAADVTISDEECQEYSVEYILVDEPEEETEEETTEAAEETTAGETEEAAEETAAEETSTEESVTEETEETSAEETVSEETTAEEETSATGEELANQVYQMAQDGYEFDDIATELGVTSDTESYLVTGETSTDQAYTTSVDMEAGEVRMVQVEGTGWYIIKRVNDYDEEATEEKRAELLETAQEEAFDAQYVEWADAAPKFKVKEKIWSQIEVTDKIYAEETEEETTDAEETEETEAAEETGEDGETSEETSGAEETTFAAEETDTEQTYAVEETSTVEAE